MIEASLLSTQAAGGRAALRAALAKYAGRWVLTIGVFDGVHAGHRAVVGRARRVADERGCGVLAITFSPRLDEVLTPDRALVGLTSLAGRIERLHAAGADEVAVIPFDREIARVSAGEYLAEMRDAFLIEALCVGEDFRIGHGSAGSVAYLQRHGVDVFVPKTVRGEDGVKLSSSRLRESNCLGPARAVRGGFGRALRDNTPFAHSEREKASH